ncbi:MAG: ABC transporter permease [Candidatus Gracilibacteria bacterium]
MNKTKPTQIEVQNENLLISLGRSFNLGLTNFWRNKFLSLATIIVMAVILFIFNTILTVYSITNQALQTLGEHVDMVVDLRDDISFYEAQNLISALQKVQGVKSVKYTSKEAALQIVSKSQPQTADFLKKFNANPLPPSVSIMMEKPEYYQKIKDFLKKSEFKNSLNNNETTAIGNNSENIVLSKVTDNLTRINQFVRQIIFWIVLVFVVGGTLVVINAIQLTIYTRRNEIYIMRLVGATPNFIRLPFIFEGILYSVFAVFLSLTFLYLVGKGINIQESNLWTFYSNLNLDKVFFAELVITVIIGIISSFTAVQQYLKGKLTVN